jgi:hypothetical protein
MGTQQILLIVLSVIIVGVAVAVGITMFNQQAINASRQATIMDMNNFAAMAIAWYRTPTSQGGAGQDATAGNTAFADLPAVTASLQNYLGFTEDETIRTVVNQEYENDNAGYTVAVIAGEIVQFSSVIKETGIEVADSPDLDLDLTDSTITAHPTGR